MSTFLQQKLNHLLDLTTVTQTHTQIRIQFPTSFYYYFITSLHHGKFEESQMALNAIFRQLDPTLNASVTLHYGLITTQYYSCLTVDWGSWNKLT